MDKKYWLVYLKPDGKYGVSDITPKYDFYSHYPKDYVRKPFQDWLNAVLLDADAQVDRGRFDKYWLIEAPDRGQAMKIAKSTPWTNEYSGVINLELPMLSAGK